jgi:predicted O-methyltransferase YrrM
VYDLFANVINKKTDSSIFKSIKNIRNSMLASNEIIDCIDYGASGSEGNNTKRKISDIAKKSAKSQKYCALLFRLVDSFKPKTILELGTSLGISTLYQALPNYHPKVITIEGCENTAAIARNNFKISGQKIDVITGEFTRVLPQILKYIKNTDYVFFDGNHRYEPTISYFEQCLEKANDNSLFVFDDIHWSDEMENAWKYIKNHEKVSISIDLFFMGLIFFRKGITKQNFIIRF